MTDQQREKIKEDVSTMIRDYLSDESFLDRLLNASYDYLVLRLREQGVKINDSDPGSWVPLVKSLIHTDLLEGKTHEIVDIVDLLTDRAIQRIRSKRDLPTVS